MIFCLGLEYRMPATKKGRANKNTLNMALRTGDSFRLCYYYLARRCFFTVSANVDPWFHGLKNHYGYKGWRRLSSAHLCIRSTVRHTCVRMCDLHNLLNKIMCNCHAAMQKMCHYILRIVIWIQMLCTTNCWPGFADMIRRQVKEVLLLHGTAPQNATSSWSNNSLFSSKGRVHSFTTPHFICHIQNMMGHIQR